MSADDDDEYEYDEEETKNKKKEEEEVQVCASCGTISEKLKRCTGCKLVYYCGRDCQVSHRKLHKKMCKKKAEEERRKWVVVFFVDHFVNSLMLPLLGSPDASMYDTLFKRKGAKQRINDHMETFTLNYISNHIEYQSDKAIKRLLEANYHSEQSLKDPLLSSMQQELYDYLETVEEFLKMS